MTGSTIRGALAPGREELKVPIWAIVPAALVPVVLTGGWLLAGLFQPASYSPIRETVSVLAGGAGSDPWIMTAALFVVGGCYLATAVGLNTLRRSARLVLVVAGAASFGIATSPEPATGPTGRHLAWTALAAVTVAVWPAFVARRSSRPLVLSIHGSAMVTLVYVGLLVWLAIAARLDSYVGLAERLASSIQTLWPFIVAVVLRRNTGHRAEGAASAGTVGAQVASVPARDAPAAGSRLAEPPPDDGNRLEGASPAPVACRGSDARVRPVASWCGSLAVPGPRERCRSRTVPSAPPAGGSAGRAEIPQAQRGGGSSWRKASSVSWWDGDIGR
ncbi:MAG: hypothetical protein JWM85_3324 [Acidimicrobiaceae bacterium]|nr:hypothetical protein [Acidimicrobiaceae bacterium]